MGRGDEKKIERVRPLLLPNAPAITSKSKMSKPMIVEANYTLSSAFHVPTEHEEAVKNDWFYVKWNKLFICDADMKVVAEVEPLECLDATQFDFKRPDSAKVVEADDYHIEAIEQEEGDAEDDDEEDVHVCKSCGTNMDDDKFQKGKMCCEKPLFHDDEEECEGSGSCMVCRKCNVCDKEGGCGNYDEEHRWFCEEHHEAEE